MELTRAERVAALFDQAIAVPRSERAAFLQRVCGDDDELERELSSLLEAHESADDFFDGMAEEVIGPASAALVARASSDVPNELTAAIAGRYRVERELGGGSVSRVFLADEVGLGRQVVIKVLPPELAATTSGERFRREIQLAARLQHPHIVPVLSADAGGRLLYYVMPFVAGESLRVRLGRDGALPIRDATRVWRDLLEALAYAHARGVVHRDIKPGNILLSGGESAVVADFGIARAIEAAGEADVTGPGVAIGTPAYMAPEQVDGRSVTDHRADLYAAALVMYEMIEGRTPFAGDSPRDVALARLTEPPSPIGRADCPPDLAALVLHCLARNPEHRPATAEEVLAALDQLSGRPAAASRRTSRRLIAAGLVALVAAGAALGAGYLRRDRDAGTASGTPAPSLAVLPLANLSPDAGDAALADGMTEELIAVLSQGRTLRVVASTSVRALRSRQLDVRQIADSLRVSHVLEGGLQKIGSKLRIQVRLVDARDGSTHWSATYDRQIGDIFAIEDEIARAVADELDLRLGPGGSPPSARRGLTTSVAAYEWYLRGRQNSLLRSDSGLREGIGYLQRAIAIDSGFAEAHAALVWLYLNKAGTTPGDHHTWYHRAEAEALEAIALDDSLAVGYAALGWARIALGEPGVETALNRAVSIDPAVHRGFEGLARYYMLTRRPAEQLAAAQRGLALDPYSVAAIREMALALSTNGRCDEALALLRPLKDLHPPAAVAGVIRGQCYATKQMWPEAIAELRWAVQTGDARTALGLLGYVLARAGQRAEAQAILSDLLSGRRQSQGAFGVGLVYAGLRDYEQAFAWLEKATQEGSVRIYIMDPLFEDLQRDPRFGRLRLAGGTS